MPSILKAPARLLHFFRLLSLDVCLGSASVLLYAQRVCAAAVPRAYFYILPASVWLVYTLDHLLDSGRCAHQSAARRHRFHYRHRRALWSVWVGLCSSTAVAALLALPPPVLLGGLCMSLGVLLYFKFLRDCAGGRAATKELRAAALYVLGTWLAPAFAAGSLAPRSLALCFLFFALAFANLLLFALNEVAADAACGFPSLPRALGISCCRRLLIATCAGVLSASALLALRAARDPVLELAPFFMAAVLLALALFPTPFRRRGRYRLCGDAIFYLPALAVLLSEWR